jgi:hypothetical protein
MKFWQKIGRIFAQKNKLIAQNECLNIFNTNLNLIVIISNFSNTYTFGCLKILF